MIKLEKKKTSLRIGYLILSFIISFMMWISVVIFLDPEQTQVINDVPVEFTGEEIIFEKRSLVLVEGRGSTRDITFRGSRSSLSQLSKENVKLIVDLSSLSSKGPRSLAYKPEFPPSLANKVYVVLDDLPSIDIRTDQIIPGNFEVKTVIAGEVAANHIAEDAIAEPAAVSLRGPSELVERISYAEVTIAREVFDKTIENALVPYVLKDAEGNIIESPFITLDQPAVSVTLPILMTKAVPLQISFEEGGGATVKNVQCDILPRTITVSGSQSELDKLNFIHLDTINLANFTGSVTERYPIIIPNGVKSITGEQEAKVSIQLTGLKERKLDVSNILLRNEKPPEGYVVNIVTNSVPVTMRGAPEVIDQLTENNIIIIVDLEGQNLPPGMRSVTARVTCPAYPSLGAISVCTITIDIAKEDAAAAGDLTNHALA